MSSDQGPQFSSQLWSSISRLLDTQLHHTTAYHPQSNGLVERFHRHLKSALRARLTSPNWMQELPWVLLGIRTAPKDDLGCSSAQIVYRAPLTVPGDFVPSCVHTHSDVPLHLHLLRDQVRGLVPVPTSQHGAVSTSVPHNLQQAEYVFIHCDAHSTPLQRPYEGPFKVMRPGPKTFIVDIGGEHKPFQSIGSSLPARAQSIQLNMHSPDDAVENHLSSHNLRLATQLRSSHIALVQGVQSSHHSGTSRFWRGVV